MNNNDLANAIIVDRLRIVRAITTGAAWEIWMQVELAILLIERGLSVAREVPYPAPNASLSLDLLAEDSAGRYAIELKVESATNAGTRLLTAAVADMTKIQKYPAPHPGARWVIAIGYSSAARKALSGFANSPANASIYQEADGIGVLVATR